ncbi:MAG TPA: KOW motif-containing protein [Candidatus Limnocylindria bacterium]
MSRSRRLRAGDSVTVTNGPYAGRGGVVLAVDGADRARVLIDECCQPIVARADLRRARRRSGIAAAIAEGKLSDADGELVRLQMDSRDLGNGF